MATFTNQATLTYRNLTTNSNVATGELLEALSATKTAVRDVYSTGNDITYVISVLNASTSPIANISISDDLGAYPFGTQALVPLDYQEGSVRLFANGVLQAAPSVTLGTGVTFSGISVPAGGNAVLIYEATPNEYAPQGSGATITNTATVTDQSGLTTVTAQETVTAEEESSLTITKSISPAVVTDNSRVTYTFVIQNSGSVAADASDNAIVTDVFNPILSDLVVTLDGVALAAGSGYTYNASTGTFETVGGTITVPAGSYSQDPETGIWSVSPGTAVLIVTGTI